MTVETTTKGTVRELVCLSSDTKPDPGVASGLAVIRETDTNKSFYWNGTAWVEGWHPILNHISFPGGTANFMRADGTWNAPGGGAPTGADYLVGTANPDLTAEIVVGTTPGGELGGTWAAPTVDSTHSGSAHHTQSHGAADHTGDVIPAANQDFGAFFSDVAQIAAPANPASGTRRLFVDSADGKLKVRTSAGTSVSLEEGAASGNATVMHMVAYAALSKTMTNIGTSYVDIYAALSDLGNDRHLIDFSGATSFRIIYFWDYVGSGSQQVRWVDKADNANVLWESATFTADQDPGDSGWTVLPAWATGEKTIEQQGKSTTAADDPQAKGFRIFLK